jgi:N-acetylneuraminate lyase
MVPVFTSFNDDKKRTINYDVIDKYALYLKTKGVHGVLVNGMTGEGMTLNVEERKRLAEEWFKVTRKHHLTLLLNIGGTNVADVYELAQHAEQLKVDAVMVLPDLFFRPQVEEDLLTYVRDVAKYCPSLPVLYYHIPLMTNVRLQMWRFYDLAEKEIKNFGGIYYADANLDWALEAAKTDRKIILGLKTVALGALTLGFNAISMPLMNIVPEWFVELYDHVLNYRLKEAMIVQERIVKRVRDIGVHDQDFIHNIKIEFNKVNTGFQMGLTRTPKWTESKVRHF